MLFFEGTGSLFVDLFLFPTLELFLVAAVTLLATIPFGLFFPCLPFGDVGI